MIESDLDIKPSDVAAHYNSLDRFYREIWGEHVHHGFWESGNESPDEAVIHLSQFLANWLKLNKGDRIVDVGCGYGGTARLLAQTYRARVTGFTLSSEQKKYADGKTVDRGSVEILCQDFLENYFRSNCFDAAISIECLEHIEDKGRAFAEIFRLLRPGKRMAIAVWAANEDPNRLQAHMLEAICREGRLPSMPSGKEYEELMEHAGFHLIKGREIAEQVKKTWVICAKRLAQKVASDASYRKFLMSSEAENKIFALTLLRIMTAFELKAMKYWVFAAEKPLRH